MRDDANARAGVSARSDRDAVAVLLTAVVCLTLSEYFGRRDRTGLIDASTQSGRLTAWAAITIVAYVAAPVAVTVFVLRRPVRDLGLRVRGIGPHWRVYGALYLIALPVVLLASYGASFQAKYPFYDLAPSESFFPNLYGWWLLYAAQFVALEFFFRGFLVHGLVPRIGWLAIFVMAVPYAMLHYGKPMPEALAAIAGALVLGTLSLKARSIWWGATLHIAIAMTMDLSALWHAGRLS